MRQAGIKAFGERKSAAEWARDARCEVTRDVLRRRLHEGWAPEEALVTTLDGKKARDAQRRPRRDSLEADRKKAAVRVFVPTPEPPRQRKARRPASKETFAEVERRRMEHDREWRSRPLNVPPVGPGTGSSVRTVSGGLPTLGRRR